MVCKGMSKQSNDDAGGCVLMMMLVVVCSISTEAWIAILPVNSGLGNRSNVQRPKHARCVTSVVTVLCRSENSNLMFAGSAEAAGEGDKG